MAGQKFSMDDYIDVAERIAEFRAKHPEGSLQQVALDFREVNGTWWVIYTAAAYRSPDDQRPGHGTAWEPVPGKTPYTKDSELQNAETAAWGRAIVAVLAADTKRGIASAQEVRSRDYSDQRGQPPRQVDDHASRVFAMKQRVMAAAKRANPGKSEAELRELVPAACEARGLDKDLVADLMKLAEEWEQQS